MPLAVDVLAQAIRVSPRDTGAATLAERYLRALHAAGYLVKQRDPQDANVITDAHVTDD